MLRAVTSAGRIATRGLRLAGRRALPISAVSVQRIGLATLSATSPVGVGASNKVELAAAADETAATAVPAGKVSQVIGAVVDVHFGMLKSFCGQGGKIDGEGREGGIDDGGKGRFMC